jgi:type IV pilus assembly protein PilE
MGAFMDIESPCLSSLGRARSRGFSLIELMIVVAIAAVLLSIAIPSYREYVRRAAVAEVTGVLGSGRVVMEQFFLDNRTYEDAPCPTSTEKFAIACDRNPTTYTITATGSDNMSGFVYTINETDTRTTDGPWGTGNCWITRKGDSC